MAKAGDGSRVQQIDHVELFVPDRYEAAAWYDAVLGLKVVARCEQWAADPQGPLMISSDGGRTMLALFRKPDDGGPAAMLDQATGSGHHRVAFRVDSKGFQRFVDRLGRVELFNQLGQQLTGWENVVDHQQAFSIYFCDPYGHRYEVTTYDYEPVAAAWAAAADIE